MAYTENTNLGEVSLYSWPPVHFVWIQLLCIWWIKTVLLVWSNPRQSTRWSAVQWYFPTYSVTRLNNLLHFGLLFRACGNNYFAQIAHIFGEFFVKMSKSFIFYLYHFWATFIDIWRLLLVTLPTYHLVRYDPSSPTKGLYGADTSFYLLKWSMDSPFAWAYPWSTDGECWYQLDWAITWVNDARVN